MRCLATAEIVYGGISGMEMSPLYPLLIIALTTITSKVCDASSHSQGILASASTFSLPLL